MDGLNSTPGDLDFVPEDDEDPTVAALISAGNNVLLFCLLMGMAASVDTTHFANNFRSPKALITGLLCQFLVMPALGFTATKLMPVSGVTSVALLTTTMAPGGAFSNLFCSLFNADLSLSIAMTTMATLCSMAVLPMNMYIYIGVLSDSDISLDWGALLLSVSTASGGLLSGVAISKWKPEWRRKCNIAASVAAVLLIIFGLVTSTKSSPVWDRPALFYPEVMFPCAMSIVVCCIVCALLRIPAPQMTAVVVECAYQNTGLSMSFVLSTFDGDARGEALGVPIFYGTCQFIYVLAFCVAAWKLGKTYCPADTPVHTMLWKGYQPDSGSGSPAGPEFELSLVQNGSPPFSSTTDDPLPSELDIVDGEADASLSLSTSGLRSKLPP